MGDTEHVDYTYQSVAEYSTVELVGEYLLASEIVGRHCRSRGRAISHLLDYGCGLGKSTRASAGYVEEGGTLTGVDISPEMVERARTSTADLMPDPGVRIEFDLVGRTGHRVRVPVDDDRVDVATSVIVLQEVHEHEELESIFSEVFRVLRSGGSFVAVCVSDRITCEEFSAFTYAPFPDNRTRDDRIRRSRSTVSHIVWENDYHWPGGVLRSTLVGAGFVNVALDHPLADVGSPPFPGQPHIPWKDELHVSPFVVASGDKP